MLHPIIGPSGSGKTEYIMERLGDAVKKGIRCYVIVPEQQSVDYESEVCRRFGDSSNLYCEILNFERLPNRIARDFGGLVVNNIDKGGACALLSVIAESLKDKLTQYSAVAANVDFAQSLLALIHRMKMGMISPEKLLANSQNISDTQLSEKIKDIALIYSQYEKCFKDDLSDPRDALTILAKELDDKPFFKNCAVFIDGYYTFTEQEYAIIKEIIRQSQDTYISFTVGDSRFLFSENEKALKRVKERFADIAQPVIFDRPKRFNSLYLKHLEKNIFGNKAEALSGDDGSIALVTAKNRFDEVESAAAEILNYVRKGGRYKDIAVIAGNADSYRPIVDAVFSRAGIPVYISAKEPLESKGLFSFVIASLAVVAEDFSLRSVKRYVKSGFSGLSVREADALLSYAASWKLRGKAWYGNEEWTLDPDGYTEGDLSLSSVKTLKIVNAARKKVAEPLSQLRDDLMQKNLTVSQALRALYNHLVNLNANEKLRENAEIILKNGDREKSEREIQLWKLLINIIDQMDRLCGDREVTAKRFMSLIRLMCDCYSLGAIPPSADSVTFGDASLIRAGNSNMVIVLGLCDGEFPSSAGVNSFFNRVEATKLEEADLVLADTVEKQLITNRFLVYTAFTAPKSKLVVSYPKSELSGEELRPSMAWFAIDKMFPDVKIKEFTEDNMLYSGEAIASYFPWLIDGDIKDSIEEAMDTLGVSYCSEEPAICQPISEIEYKAEELKLSPSTFEKYICCPFSYFGRYILRLQEKKLNEFAGREIGNAAHKLLEQFMKKCISNGIFNCPDKTEREQIIKEEAQRYLDKVIGNDAQEDKRFMHSYRKMLKIVSFVADCLCDEFSDSKFIPHGFEYKIGLGDNEDIPAIRYTVDGKRVLLRGSIDRVDVYEKDGQKYVRVIDYKTYNKGFSLDLVAQGLDTQLLHYLFAFCEKNNGKPAGAMYYNVVLPSVTVNGGETEEELRELLIKNITRDGILIDDKDIVFAMSPDCRHVPVSKTSTGLRKSGKLLSEEGFDQLSQQLSQQVQDLSHNIFSGSMNIAPNDCDGKKKPCQYCSFGDMCRIKNLKEEEESEYDETEN